ncbi:uncharacterized protein LOC116164441 [Photinus pyralis]|nr:uncharacterized protein LOC116164441 [Photinus pyralis]
MKKVYVTKKQKYYVVNTCAFDAVLQGLAAAFCDSIVYMQFVNNQRDDIADLINSLVSVGASPATYRLRAEILFNSKDTFRSNKLLNNVIQIECQCNAINVLQRFCKVYLSACDVRTCLSPTCNQVIPKINMMVLPININILTNNFSSLEAAISNAVLKVSNCECGSKISHTVNVFDNVFIDTNGCGKTMLRNVPFHVQIFSKTFILRSVVNFKPPCNFELGKEKDVVGHYTCYARRIDSTWELFDDLSAKVVQVHGEIEVEPHLLLYTV